jgi:hypothetical protein
VHAQLAYRASFKKGAQEETMAALKKTMRPAASSGAAPRGLSTRIELATAESAPVESGAHQLRLHLEAALAGARHAPTADEGETERWSRPVRAAILTGAVVIPWSLIALTAHAIVTRRLFPWVY